MTGVMYRKIRRLKNHHGRLYLVLSCGHVVRGHPMGPNRGTPKVGQKYPCRVCTNRKKK